MSNELQLALQLDHAFDRLLRGDPIVAVEEDFERQLIPYLEAFAALLELTSSPARPEYRAELRRRFVGGGSATAPADGVSLLGRAAAIIAATFLVGSAINPALARNLVQSVSDTMGAEIAAVVESVLQTGTVAPATDPETTVEGETPAGDAPHLLSSAALDEAPLQSTTADASPVDASAGTAPAQPSAAPVAPPPTTNHASAPPLLKPH